MTPYNMMISCYTTGMDHYDEVQDGVSFHLP